MVKGNTGSGIRQNTSKSGVSFGVVLTSEVVKNENIISESSSVDITDGAKLTKAKKLPYKTANNDAPKGHQKVHLYPALGSYTVHHYIITRDFLRVSHMSLYLGINTCHTYSQCLKITEKVSFS